MRTCETPIPDDVLIDYWAGDGAPDRTESVEAHLFSCRHCTARLSDLASITTGLAELVRHGRLSGIIPRTLMNRLQRDGVRVRLYVLSPGERVPCTVFPGDDLVVAALRADLSTVRTVAMSVVGNGSIIAQYNDVAVAPGEQELFWALPGSTVRDMPTIRLDIALRAADGRATALGDYVLEHSAGS